MIFDRGIASRSFITTAIECNHVCADTNAGVLSFLVLEQRDEGTYEKRSSAIQANEKTKTCKESAVILTVAVKYITAILDTHFGPGHDEKRKMKST